MNQMKEQNGLTNGCLDSVSKWSVINGVKSCPQPIQPKHRPHVNEEPPFHIVLLCYFSYVVLIAFGYLRDFLRNTGIEKNNSAVEVNREVFKHF